MTGARLSVLLAGDALIARPWSHVQDPAFRALVDLVRSTDVALLNLETVIHEFRGHAQADSGGTYTHAPPQVAADLAWAGFDLVAHANNHTFDYGSTAVLETLEHAERAGLVVAGSGRDLQNARAPRYLRHGDATVGVVAMASTFVSYGRASRSRPDLGGRPGLNPLRLHPRKRTIVLPARLTRILRAVAERSGSRFKGLGDGSFEYGIRFHEGRFRICRDWSPARDDRIANLEAIAEAARNADFVVVSIHAHDQGPWLRTFAREALAHGAGVVFVHGPHRVGAVELQEGGPVLYSLGDFVYEATHVAKFPSDAYERLRLGDDADAQALMAAPGPLNTLDKDPATFEGVVAALHVADGAVERIRLHPIDLQFAASPDKRGRPQLADAVLGRRIVDKIAAQSRACKTSVTYDAAANVGEIVCRKTG